MRLGRLSSERGAPGASAGWDREVFAALDAATSPAYLFRTEPGTRPEIGECSGLLRVRPSVRRLALERARPLPLDLRARIAPSAPPALPFEGSAILAGTRLRVRVEGDGSAARVTVLERVFGPPFRDRLFRTATEALAAG